MKVSTIAGKSGISGLRDGILSDSLFYYPGGLCLDREGNLMVADTWNNCVREIDLERGTVSVIAGCAQGFENGDALTEAKFISPLYLVTRGDIIYVLDSANGTIRKIRDGVVSTFVTGLSHPLSITIDGNGGILVADSGNYLIKRIDTEDGSIRVFPKLIQYPIGITVSPNGTIYVSTNGGNIYHWDNDEWKILIRTNGLTRGLRADSFGNLLFSNMTCIKRVSLADGRISLLAGSEEKGSEDGFLSEATFQYLRYYRERFFHLHFRLR